MEIMEGLWLYRTNIVLKASLKVVVLENQIPWDTANAKEILNSSKELYRSLSVELVTKNDLALPGIFTWLNTAK